MRSVYYFFLVLLLPVFLHGQEVELKRERVFTGAGLYGFMNGGADLFLEYGVTLLTNRDIVFKGENYTIDIYEFSSPEDAFGIYSMHVFRCQRADTLGCIDCLSPYQLQAVVGNKYVSVVFPSGSTAAQQAVDELIRKYVGLDGKDKPGFPKQLITQSPYSGQIYYTRGPISVSNVSKDLSVLLKETVYSGVWIKNDKGSNTYQAYILLPGKEAGNQIKERMTSTNILAEGDNFLFIRGEEKEDDSPDYGPFGF